MELIVRDPKKTNRTIHDFLEKGIMSMLVSHRNFS